MMILSRSIRETNLTNISRFAKLERTGRLFAHAVWNSYLIAENLRMARLNAASELAGSVSQT